MISKTKLNNYLVQRIRKLTKTQSSILELFNKKKTYELYKILDLVSNGYFDKEVDTPTQKENKPLDASQENSKGYGTGYENSQGKLSYITDK
jgi:hypothetical protein